MGFLGSRLIIASASAFITSVSQTVVGEGGVVAQAALDYGLAAHGVGILHVGELDDVVEAQGALLLEHLAGEVAQILALRNEAHADAVVRMRGEGKTIPEIVEAEGISRATVYRILRDAEEQAS